MLANDLMKYNDAFYIWLKYFLGFYPQDWLTVRVDGDHYFHTWCLSVGPYVRSHFSNKFQVRIVIATGLAEGIIDEKYVL